MELGVEIVMGIFHFESKTFAIRQHEMNSSASLKLSGIPSSIFRSFWQNVSSSSSEFAIHSS